MAEQLQFRQGTTVQHSTFTGAVAEITIDTDKDVAVVHDGTTAGGHPLAKQSNVDLKANDNAVVKLTGDQTIDGIKTHTSIPVLPAVSPTTDNQVTRKKYVDDGLALKTGIGTATPLAPAVTAVVGVSTNASRQDHVHPTNFTATATDIKMDGVQAVGTLTTYPRADHVHPSDTSKANLASPTLTGTPLSTTAAVGTNTTQIATTAFVNAEIVNDTYVKDTANWRDTMMSKSEFNAVAAERRANRAGSGADNFGKGSATTTLNVNEGTHTSTTVPNTFYLGKVGGTGTSTADAYIASINGSVILAKYLNTTTADATLLLPPAPTVLPSTATLTQQQIDSGVIKHADASNSGLLLNGKFDTDTSGWTTSGTGTLVVEAGRAKHTVPSTTQYFQVFQTIVGKQYNLEFQAEGLCTPYISTGSSSTGAILNMGYANRTNVRESYSFTATTTTTYFVMYSTVGTSYLDNIAVFPADAISRSDLAFLESWHEDVSEKDFVYPLGNVQYLGTTGDSGTPVAGAFAGAATYSLFSDTWQADSALIGKGYVWSTLSDANKKAFVANPENNCYLDGDKVIQVRYRMRVAQGLGDSWPSIGTDYSAYTSGFAIYFNTSSFLVCKGKNTYVVNDLYAESNNSFYVGSSAITRGHIRTSPDGLWYGGNATSTYAYEGKCVAIPIATIHRRNTGMKHDTYNPNGTKLASDSLPWYSTTVSFTSIADCFTDSKLLATSGYIGTTTGRADGIFYDQVSEMDITDLRNNSAKVQDYNRLIDKEFNKLVAGSYRGSQGELNTEVKTQTTTGTVATVEVNDGTKYKSGDVIYIYDLTASAIKGRYTVKSISTNTLTVDVAFAKLANSYMISGGSTTRTKSNNITMTDLIGSPSNLPASMKLDGRSFNTLHTAEDGTSLLPTGTTGSDGLAVYKLSRKANATPLQVLKSTDSGATWTALTVTTHYTFSTTANAITFTAGNIPLVAHLIMVTYQTHTNMCTATTNQTPIAIGEAIATNGVAYGHLVSSLIGKVPTASTAPYAQFGYDTYGYRIDATTLKFSTTSTEFPIHTSFTLAGGALGVATVKAFPYLTSSNGKAYVNIPFKEMKHNGTSYGDDGKFFIADNVTTTTDNNALTILTGTKRIELPYFIGAAE